jgi:aminocarboxymuconate-semialdehyde decarboxylase
MTLAATRLVLSGVLERFPRLILILGQLGGALPLLAERVERGYAIYPELSGSLQRSPTEYFRMMYFDTVPYGRLGIPLTYEFAGPKRIVLASDHPHQIGDLQECASVIEAMEIPDEHKASMLGGNMARLLKLAG